jgi:hypothetical protein
MPAVHNIIKPNLGEKVIIKDVTDSEDEKRLSGGTVIKYPFQITIVDQNNEVVFNDVTTSQTYTSNWSKAFYVSKTGQIRYSKNKELLAICKIMEAHDAEAYKAYFNAKGEFDINQIIGLEFTANIIRKDQMIFIDWVSTLRNNGVSIPPIGTDGAITDTAMPGEVKVDIEDLPFN